MISEKYQGLSRGVLRKSKVALHFESSASYYEEREQNCEGNRETTFFYYAKRIQKV